MCVALLRVVFVIGRDEAAAEHLVRSVPPASRIAFVLAVGDPKRLSKRLRAGAKLSVVDVTKATTLAPDHVYIVPKDRETTIEGEQLIVGSEGTPSCDRLLRSAARAFGPACASVILGGTGADGVLGTKRVKELGGVTLCQHTTNGDASELPRSASALGIIDLTLPAADIGPRLYMLANPPAQLVDEVTAPAPTVVQEILVLLRGHSGHDFSPYKPEVLVQRIARRMQFAQIATLLDYQRFLREHAHERTQLFRDLLLDATDFFREPESYAALADHVIPLLFRGRRRTDQIRVWVAGCASGEEAYTVAMLLSEYADRLRDPPRLQVFASDVDADELREARAGIYPRAIAEDVSADRLRRFFTRENDQYRVADELRTIILFSKHNLLRDPPFSRIDLICCRTVLGRLNPEAREQILDAFHFALRPAGHLFLGPSDDPDLRRFTVVDREHRLFERSRSATIPAAAPLPATIEAPATTEPPSGYRSLLDRYTPPSVLVDDNLDVVHATPNARAYLQEPHDGNRSVLRLIHPVLSSPLHAAILAAREVGRGSVTRVVRFEENGVERAIELRVRATRNGEAPAVLVTLDDLASDIDVSALSTRSEQRVERLEDDLEMAREQLRTTISQYERALDELRDSNEELRVMNEQLRSATGELDSGRAELHAVNEQLLDVIRDLRAKINDVSRSNGDLQALVTSAQLPVLFLDAELRIERFTPRVQALFNVIASDAGRPLGHITHRLEPNDLLVAAAEVLRTHQGVDREIRTRDGRQYLARLGPYRLPGERVGGVVLTFFDVTDLRSTEEALHRSEEALHASEQRLTTTLRATQVALITHGDDLAVTWGYVNGRELGKDLSTVLAPEQTARYADVVREVFATGARGHIELELRIGEKSQPYEFQVERAGAGVTAIGFSSTRAATERP